MTRFNKVVLYPLIWIVGIINTILSIIQLFVVGIVGLIPFVLFGKKYKNIGQYIANCAISCDQSVNGFTGGSSDETISSRLGRYRGKNWLADLFSKFLDLFEKDHVTKYIETPDKIENEIIK